MQNVETVVYPKLCVKYVIKLFNDNVKLKCVSSYGGGIYTLGHDDTKLCFSVDPEKVKAVWRVIHRTISASCHKTFTYTNRYIAYIANVVIHANIHISLVSHIF